MQALLSISRFLRFSFSVILACLLIFGGCLLKPGGLDASGDGGFSPINPAYLAFMQSEEVSTMEALSSGSTETKGLGYTPSPLNLSDLSGTPVSPEGPLALAATFEPVFDLREQNRVSPVKDQGNDNTCWAFAAMGSSEAGLLRFVVTPNPSAWNFSEWHLGYLAYKDATARSFTLGTGDVFMKGGNDWKSIALLSRWTGIVSESVCPYGGSLPSGNEPQIRHLQDAYYLPIQSGVGFSAENVKTALKNFGPVSVAFYWNSTYYNSSSGAYFYTGNSSPNHAVVIVGWDDNYSSSNFKTPPSGNGAWIVKNSWGTDWGKNGYFYLSYFDSSLEGGVAYRADAGTNYARVYDYDPLGWIGSWGSYSPSGTYTPSTTAWMANIFTAVASEPLRAVSFYAGSPDTAYEIRIYRGVSTGAPRSGQIASSQPESGTLDIPGYRTVVLGTPASLQAGERFSVVVKLTTPASYRPIPVEYRVAGYSDNAAASTNQSFVSLDGTAWQDAASLSNPSNVCLKAFTGTGTSSGTPETPTETTPTTPSTPSDSGGGGGGGCNLGLFPSFGLALLVPLLALIRRKR